SSQSKSETDFDVKNVNVERRRRFGETRRQGGSTAGAQGEGSSARLRRGARGSRRRDRGYPFQQAPQGPGDLHAQGERQEAGPEEDRRRRRRHREPSRSARPGRQPGRELGSRSRRNGERGGQEGLTGPRRLSGSGSPPEPEMTRSQRQSEGAA